MRTGAIVTFIASQRVIVRDLNYRIDIWYRTWDAIIDRKEHDKDHPLFKALLAYDKVSGTERATDARM